MSTLKLIFLTLSICLSTMTHALKLNEFNCESLDGNVNLSVVEHSNFRNTIATQIKITSINETIELFAITTHQSGTFMSKNTYTITGDSKGSLVIVKKPKFCGRGSCDYNSNAIITGQLEFDNTTTLFLCYE